VRKTRIKANNVIVILIGTLCLTILVAVARPQNNQSPHNSVTEKKPLLIIKDQPDSPLTITSVIVDNFPDPRMPTIDFNVMNNSGKRIMVYAIKHEAALGSRGAMSGWIAINSPDNKRALRPGKAPQVEISRIQYPQPPESFTLSVDFVEFVDGTRWGEDTFKNGDRIDGVRAGANAQREALMKILKAGGPEEVIRLLDSIEPKPDQSTARSAEWRDGFRHGVGWMRERVRLKGPDRSEIEKELRPPVDSKRMGGKPDESKH
jgi:hypothetical protein